MCHRIFHFFFKFYLSLDLCHQFMGFMTSSRFWLISRKSMSTTPHFSMFRARPARRSCGRTGRRRGSCRCWGWWPCPRTRRCSWPGSGGCRSWYRGPGDPPHLCQVVCSNAVSHQAPQQTCPPGPQDQQCSESTALVWRRRSSDTHWLIFYVLL